MKKVAIMPGHGGSDSGAVNHYYGQNERDFNWREAVELSNRLKSAGCQVCICRKENVDESLSVMQERANAFKAEICFCLHHNAYDGQVSGWDVYYSTDKSKTLAERVHESYRVNLSIGPHGSGLKRATATDHRRAYNCIHSCEMPTVLLESCFIDRNEDCKWLMNGGWLEVVDALYDVAVEDSVSVSPFATTPVDDEKLTPHDLCEIYVDLYHQGLIEVPGLMAMSFAQWMLESGWCTSELAQNAFNFGGLKDRPEVDRGGTYDYKGEKYERFDSPEDYILGYWEFLERSPYKEFNENKTEYEHDPIAFIKTIGAIYCPTAGYVEKVLNVYHSQRFRKYRLQLEKATGQDVLFQTIVEILGIVRGGRFSPISHPASISDGQRLTQIRMMEARSPESAEITLAPYEGRLIVVRGLPGSLWIYEAEVVEIGGPLLSQLALEIIEKGK
jgi:hypothetical protein